MEAMRTAGAATRRPSVPVGTARQPRPAAPLAARAGQPLPRFESPEGYRNYVIKLVAQAQDAERELADARARLNAGHGSQAAVAAMQERLDALTLQLAVLRDRFDTPLAWRWLHGFDKDRFWRERIEALPVRRVALPPRPVEPPPASSGTRTFVLGAVGLGVAALGGVMAATGALGLGVPVGLLGALALGWAAFRQLR